MKIYFAGSIRGGRQDQALYLELIETLSQYGVVLTEHVGDPRVFGDGDFEPADPVIYERDMSWLKSADVVVAEVTIPSLGVGYEIAMAETMDTPILCLYRPQAGKSLSAMLTGNPKLTIREYCGLGDVQPIMASFFAGESLS